MTHAHVRTGALLFAISSLTLGCSGASTADSGTPPTTRDAAPTGDDASVQPGDASMRDDVTLANDDGPTDAQPIDDDAGVIPGDSGTGGGAVPAFDDATAAHVRDLVARGTAMGNHHEVFAKIGDSISESASFLFDCGYGWTDFGSDATMQSTVQYFSTYMIGDRNSFNRASVSAVGGWTAAQALEGDPDSAVSRELTALHPQWAIVMYGTNDLERFDIATYTANMNRIVDIIESRGTVAVLSTIPPRTDGEPFASRVPTWNQAITGIARTRHLPLIDYNQALQPLPTEGISPDGIHPNVYRDPDDKSCYLAGDGLQYGYNVRNYTALVMLGRLRGF